LVAGPGISLTVDAPYGVNCKLNILRASYLCQNFSENIHTKKEDYKKENCFRSTYATGSGVLTASTPNRYDMFVQMCHTCFEYYQIVFF
jgi:hypothetical protein